MKLFDVYPLYDVTPVRAKDVYVYDEKGTEYLDLYGGHAVISIGHGQECYLERLSHQMHQIGFYSNNEDYFHKYNFDLASFSTGDVVYFKIYVQDDVNPITEIPNNGSPFVLLQHFSLTII